MVPSLSFQVAAYYTISRWRIEQPGNSLAVIFLFSVSYESRLVYSWGKLAARVPWPLVSALVHCTAVC